MGTRGVRFEISSCFSPVFLSRGLQGGRAMLRGWLSVKRSNFFETNPAKNVARDFGSCKDQKAVDGLVLRRSASRLGVS